ncbi:asparagine synthase (glutamine-hydrolyzing) [Thermococcus gammatolerans]|uniref:Putative asparagine synthetase [glutamine-hydrolyzing] n=1 Tax=Thermococcus gammatolerans (strain DSM 15229 / JCM 11827 / EJ3) TaxID=593117 RepID=C5A2K1_THEGJ|nr:asparagine synthase (glutamine-hydrolyzing) [Thermococcus gammatolerans]ACS32503.1 putative asparagine synthase, glutamine-hydrolyzing [Thermococcus gammatolerans EJ3]
MCGINGFSWSDEGLVREMNVAIRHRGPDDEGVYVDDNVSLGHVRLAIIDLSPKGHQPMRYEKNGHEVWIVYNGEVYNFMELREELEKKGYVFNSNTDTEVILAAYLEWGFDCVKKFNGMWAFAIYDKTKKLLFLSRDRFGIKPLYYYYDGQNLIFSSEIKAILKHEIKREPNDAVIFDFLYYNLLDHTEDTFFEGIKRLMPSHSAVFDIKTRELRIFKYYDLRKRLKKLKKAEEDPATFRKLFKKAVKRRLIADVPVGSCLSGGLDSSSIVCMMRELEKNLEIKTFSLIFPGFKLDESKYQESVMQKCSVKRYTTTFTAEDILRDLEDLIYTQEEPFSTLSIYGQYRVMKLANENGMKVLLDGQGSDEILAGYHYFFGYYYYELFRHLKWKQLIREIIYYRKNVGSFKALKYFIGLLLPRRIQEWILNHDTYLSREFIKRFKHRKDLRFKKKELNDALVCAVMNNLPHLLRFEDKNSMRWSIETRVPFLDPELVEYALSTPSQAKIRNGITKYILRESLKGIVPDIILDRRDKIGFATPDNEIANHPEIKKFIWNIINSESFKKRKYWNWKKVHKVYYHHSTSKLGNIFIGELIWKVVILELWLRVWIENKSARREG